jgi:glycosyltransferase involved in cell wall biosynthesis
VTRLVVSMDQLYRPQPGGIASYVRGLLQGLAALDDAWDVCGVAPRGRLADPPEVATTTIPVDVATLTRLWRYVPLGVASDADVVHATTLAGPFAGGRRGAIHSVAVHDLLWRDRPEATTPRGVRFHEGRLRFVRSREEMRVMVSSPGLGERLVAEGFDASRLHQVRLGVDDATPAADSADVAAVLSRVGVTGPYSLYVGTREPRKNIARLVAAHATARRRRGDLGPLVLVGPSGWGVVDTADAIVLGPQPRALVKGLLRDATVMAYVALAEGWGLPPVEALFAGTRVVASADCPSVAGNGAVVRVDPLDVDSIADGLMRALDDDDDAAARDRRHRSVAEMTWANSARDHVAGWQ